MLRPEILRMQIIEVMGLRKFTSASDGLNSQVKSVEDLFSKEVSSDKLKTHVKETGEAILSLARQGYPNLALSYIPSFTAMYEQLPNNTILTTG